MIVSRNYYYARPGAAQAVLEQRLRACDVRQQIGLPRGRVLRRLSGAPELPDVIWETEFDDLAAHHADMAARAASPEFEAIRHGMRQLYRRFERPLYVIRTVRDASAQTQYSYQHIDFIDIFCNPGDDGKVWAVLQAAPANRLLQLITAQTDIAQFVWTLPAGAAVPPIGLPADVPARVERSAWRLAD